MLKVNAILCAFLIICVFLCGCSRKEETVLAKVNGAELTLNDLYAEIPEDYWDGVTQEQKLQFLERWINGELLYQEALRRGKITVTKGPDALLNSKQNSSARSHTQDGRRRSGPPRP